MGAHRYQSTWRGITFNRVYDDTGLVDDPAHLVAAYANSDYRLESLDLTSVQTLDYRELRQHLEGANANQSFEGVRLIVGRGTILGSDPADLEDKTWALYEAFSPAACRAAFTGNTPPGTGPFSFKRASSGGAKALRFFAKPAAGRPVVVGRMREGLSRPFLFQLVAIDPFAYDEALTQTTLTPAGGNVTNPGNVYTRPRLVITMAGAGSATQTITNTTTGQVLVIDQSSSSANTFTLDTREATFVRDSGSVDVYNRITSGFPTDLYLVPGVNAITFANTTNLTSVRFDFRGAYA